MLATKVTTSNNTNNSTNTANVPNVKQPAKPVVEQKENSANEMLEAALQENWTKLGCANSKKTAASTKPANGGVAATSAISDDAKNAVKKRKLLNAVKSDNPLMYECESGMCKSCDGKNIKVKNAPTAIAAEPKSSIVRPVKFCQAAVEPEPESLDDILDFIEGNNTNKKDSQKKAAKKAKQKQKKEDVKRMEELEQLRDQFHEVFFKETDIKNDLKNLKSVKKRDKKKITELENSIKKYGKFKSKIESNILELIGTLKKNNVEFKFAYLPTKEQQLEKQQQQLAQNNASAAILTDQVKAQIEKSNNVRIIQSDQSQENQPRCEISLDQSKRMVTIRRINLPHAEPQVTVTAKGISPDKDKLLYTFINGQLIPGSNVSTAAIPTNVPPASATINTIRINSNEKIDKKVKQAQNAQIACSVKSTKKPIETVATDKLTKKAGKEKPVDKIADKKQSNEKGGSRKQSPENSKVNLINESNNKKQMAINNTTASNNSKTAKNAANAVKEAKDKQKKKSKKDIENEVETITSSVKDIALDEEKPKKEKKKAKAVKFEYADPNYKVNQFGLLDMDEDDDYYIQSSSDDDSEPEPPKIDRLPTIIKPQTPPVQIVSVQDQQTQQISNTNNNKNTKTKQTKNSNSKTPTPTATAETAKRLSTDTNAKTHTVKPEKKLATDINQISSTKPQSNQILSNAYAAATTIAAIPTATAKAVDNNLTKKQKKKLAQKQQQQQPAVNLAGSKANAKVDATVNTLNNSMQRMRLNSDTIIEPANSNQNAANKVKVFSSIKSINHIDIHLFFLIMTDIIKCKHYGSIESWRKS